MVCINNITFESINIIIEIGQCHAGGINFMDVESGVVIRWLQPFEEYTIIAVHLKQSINMRQEFSFSQDYNTWFGKLDHI